VFWSLEQFHDLVSQNNFLRFLAITKVNDKTDRRTINTYVEKY
jgi:hypothetical protein